MFRQMENQDRTEAAGRSLNYTNLKKSWDQK